MDSVSYETARCWPKCSKSSEGLYCKTKPAQCKEYFAIFNVAYKLVVGFAAVGIINAVFIQETFKVAASDDTVMMRQKAAIRVWR